MEPASNTRSIADHHEHAVSAVPAGNAPSPMSPVLMGCDQLADKLPALLRPHPMDRACPEKEAALEGKARL
eukprot:1157531-Pelagomonas_calceolata.AAC.2